MPEIKNVCDPSFRRFGRVIKEIPLGGMREAALQIPMPENGGCEYLASVPEIEDTEGFRAYTRIYAGGQNIQGGICWGYNTKMNGVEYHRSSEVNIALDDVVMMLGDRRDIGDDNTFDSSKMEFYFVPAGTAVELYATTLHLAPCQINEDGFRVLVFLPKGTNSPLSKKQMEEVKAADGEYRLLFAVDKWSIVYPGDKDVAAGAFPGVKGEVLEYLPT